MSQISKRHDLISLIDENEKKGTKLEKTCKKITQEFEKKHNNK